MPELPEVETVTKDLAKLIVGRQIVDIEMPYKGIMQTPLSSFTSNCMFEDIVAIERFGKYILICFANDYVLRVHLRMEGKFYVTPTNDSPEIDKHVHIIMRLDNGSYLKYHDVRKFGTFEVIPYVTNWHDDPKFATLGYEPWDVQCTPEFVYTRLQKSRTTIKAFLLNQKTIVGLGNIYVDEVLFRMGIHPERIAQTLTKKQASDIIVAAKEVMEFAIALGGTTIRTYQSTLGIDGLFQNELKVHLQEGQPCPTCGTEIVKEKVSGRGTYYCPKCQKKRK